ncbi:MAG: DUF362 domain-containing protein [Candidatus Scalindua sp. AMX11]|nr:MAG: DUF362 domain-containing protein [Candidatus Scalindua sp.]NOG84838.1 DUF362 domain-containing protein [Planctomycetota bacterium]RZV61718.1 MAG: DUF362 domain-containing protein [Candidatus Scalindua sp. SCAELEC01]TDE63268.1 MAG: DUF362 domain-containing protein [Candidatus Scalindua sp. AMX11]GJQ60933.1 MAG: hypothetical protein SCALA701_37340 [Candidatus Scalindua sp.]
MKNANRVSLVTCSTYSEQEVSNAIDKTFSYFGGIESIVKKGEKVLLKPNFLKASSPRKCVITHPIVIETVARKVLEAGAVPIIGDSPAFGSIKKIASYIGLDKVARDLGIDIIELDKPRKVSFECGGKKFTLTVSGKALDVDTIINLPKLKAHVQLLYTAGIKNMYGCVSGKRKVWRHFMAKNDLEWYADMLIANYQLVKPSFTILDSIQAMEEKGPTGGLPKDVSLIVGGRDGISLDRIVAELLFVNPQDVPVLRAAERLKTGVQDLSHIELVGEDLSSVRVDDFILPELKPIGFDILRVTKSIIKHQWLKLVGEKGQTGMPH